MNLTGYTNKELVRTAEYAVRPALQQAARDELIRRAISGEDTLRIGRRAMGNDQGRVT